MWSNSFVTYHDRHVSFLASSSYGPQWNRLAPMLLLNNIDPIRLCCRVRPFPFRVGRGQQRSHGFVRSYHQRAQLSGRQSYAALGMGGSYDVELSGACKAVRLASNLCRVALRLQSLYFRWRELTWEHWAMTWSIPRTESAAAIEAGRVGLQRRRFPSDSGRLW